MGDEEHRTEAAILEITRRVRGGFELRAAANARLRQAVKRFEAAADPLGPAGNGGGLAQRRRAGSS